MFLTRFNLRMLDADGGGEGGNNNPGGVEGGGDNNPAGEPKGGEPKTFTQDELDAILASRVERAKRDAVETYKQSQKDKQDEAKKFEKMSDKEKANFENEELKKQVARLESEANKIRMAAQARNKLSELNINVQDGMLDVLVTEDAETTLQNVNNFAEIIEKAVEDRYQKDRIGKTPGSATPGSGKLSLSDRLTQDEQEPVKVKSPWDK